MFRTFLILALFLITINFSFAQKKEPQCFPYHQVLELMKGYKVSIVGNIDIENVMAIFTNIDNNWVIVTIQKNGLTCLEAKGTSLRIKK